eukprot:scaffold7125_cov54-Phaeocystis_antarctica.AAC.5
MWACACSYTESWQRCLCSTAHSCRHATCSAIPSPNFSRLVDPRSYATCTRAPAYVREIRREKASRYAASRFASGHLSDAKRLSYLCGRHIFPESRPVVVRTQ